MGNGYWQFSLRRRGGDDELISSRLQAGQACKSSLAQSVRDHSGNLQETSSISAEGLDLFSKHGVGSKDVQKNLEHYKKGIPCFVTCSMKSTRATSKPSQW